MRVRPQRLRPTGQLPQVALSHDDLRAFAHLECGEDLILEGDGGAGKNRLVSIYLTQRASLDDVAVHIVGRWDGPVLSTIRVFKSLHDWRSAQHPEGPCVLWIDEANKHDIDAVDWQDLGYDQMIFTYSRTQGYELPLGVFAAIQGRGSAVTLLQDYRSVMRGRHDLQSLLGPPRTFLPAGDRFKRGRVFFTRASSEPLITAIVILAIAAQCSWQNRILVVVERPETEELCRRLEIFFQGPPLELLRYDQLQGKEAETVILPTAEALSLADRTDGLLFELEVISKRARSHMHVIMQGPSIIPWAFDDDLSMPFNPEFSDFFGAVRSRNCFADIVGNHIAIYDAQGRLSRLVIVFDSTDPGKSAQDVAVMAVECEKNGLPFVVVPKKKLLNGAFFAGDYAFRWL